MHTLLHRAGGNGTAGMAMPVLAFEKEKMASLGPSTCSNLRMRYRMVTQSGSP